MGRNRRRRGGIGGGDGEGSLGEYEDLVATVIGRVARVIYMEI